MVCELYLNKAVIKKDDGNSYLFLECKLLLKRDFYPHFSLHCLLSASFLSSAVYIPQFIGKEGREKTKEGGKNTELF